MSLVCTNLLPFRLLFTSKNHQRLHCSLIWCILSFPYCSVRRHTSLCFQTISFIAVKRHSTTAVLFDESQLMVFPRHAHIPKHSIKILFWILARWKGSSDFIAAVKESDMRRAKRNVMSEEKRRNAKKKQSMKLDTSNGFYMAFVY